jgi:hypothetical protein
MKWKLCMMFAAVIGIGVAARAWGQTVAAPAGKTLAATMNIYVFPTTGQTPEVQSKDEGDCYNYAVTQTGTDPFELAKQSDQQKQQAAQAQKDAQSAGKGSGATGAVKGAAGGALIGAIAGDTGKGAAIGAGVGLLAGRQSGKKQKAQAESQAKGQAQAAQAATAEQSANFKKAFSVCLEAKKYMVKF